MKNIVLPFLISILGFNNLAVGQLVPSSCLAPDSIRELYLNDAQMLVVQKIERRNSALLDSIEIPSAHTDSILRAIIAVYNANTLPARNTVIDSINIHANINPYLFTVEVFADSNLLWM